MLGHEDTLQDILFEIVYWNVERHLGHHLKCQFFDLLRVGVFSEHDGLGYVTVFLSPFEDYLG